jgi:hypothetical protein
LCVEEKNFYWAFSSPRCFPRLPPTNARRATPEGEYRVCGKNPASRFFKALVLDNPDIAELYEHAPIGTSVTFKP